MQFPRIILKPRRAKPFFGMHPWVFAGAIDRVEGDPSDGAVVDLVSHAGNFIARGLFNSQSKIRVRLYTWSEAQDLDESFFRQQLASAISLRRDVLRLGGPGHACRLVFSEADGISGLIVDQYDRWLALQFTGLGMARRQDMWVRLLVESLHPAGIYLRTERGIGQIEGLELRDQLILGSAPEGPIVIDEAGLKLRVHLAEGQKTGYYLDQRDNRQVVAPMAKGRRMLDAFCYTGGFGLHASRAGAVDVLGVDQSEPALELARSNAALNGLANLTFERSDVFDKLDALVSSGQRFGVIVLDPPKFARVGAAVEEALRGYRRLLSQALRLLEPTGILVMCCCSGLIQRESIHELLSQTAAEGRRFLQILESRGAAADHPTSAACPETQYLKCVICRVL